MSLSVVIPTYEGESRTQTTVDAIARSRVDLQDAEIIVVDDGSQRPPHLTTPDGWPGDLVVHHFERNQGRASACNAGLALAQGELILILDDDMSPAPGLLEGHLAAHGSASEPLAIVGRIESLEEHFRGRFGRFLMRQEEERHHRLQTGANAVPFQDCLTGHFSAPRHLLRDIGGYSEAFSLYGYEDIELAWRLRADGRRLVYNDGLVTTHRSEHATFLRACERHVHSGTMARTFSRLAGAPEVDAFLRIEGMRAGGEATTFRRLMARTHSAVRRTPRFAHPALLALARSLVLAGELALPTRMLHVLYHLVLDMHYSAGIAADAEWNGER